MTTDPACNKDDTDENPAEPVVNRRGIGGWLERNEIFFKTIASTSLTLVSIVVALSSLYVADQSRIISKLNLQIARIQQQPALLIQLKFSDAAEFKNGIETMVIQNVGGLIRNFDYDSFVFLELFSVGKLPIQVPLRSYYPNIGQEPQLTGQLVMLSNIELVEGNFGKTQHLRNELEEISTQRGQPVYSEIRRYISVSYTDIWGDRHNETYYVDPWHPNKLLRDGDAQALRTNTWCLSNTPSLNKITGEKLYEEWLCRAAH